MNVNHENTEGYYASFLVSLSNSTGNELKLFDSSNITYYHALYTVFTTLCFNYTLKKSVSYVAQKNRTVVKAI